MLNDYLFINKKNTLDFFYKPNKEKDFHFKYYNRSSLKNL